MNMILFEGEYEITCQIGEVVFGNDHKIKFIDYSFGAGVYENETYRRGSIM